ncbi:polyphosphate kinase 1 [Seleniivibrio woodruffii]|uniref:polyphosphate kinase 1 n=1 Tax=Seleniivibrio woodruffii TaxID=1078050 RepID=UPI0026F1FC38|nr:polyphosphate kinase 1 [Seleniivibrio woodruffii]
MSVSPYINRELSWLEFNRRVMMEAVDSSVPLLERLKFLAIFSSNLDEFFMIRVGGLRDQIEAGYTKLDASGSTPEEQLEHISAKAHELTSLRQEIFGGLKKDLEKEGIMIAPTLTANLDDITEAIFNEEIYPVISPVTLSSNNPMPFIHNLRLCLYVLIKKEGVVHHSIIILPENLRRIFRVKLDKTYFLFTEDILTKYLNIVYPDYEVLDSYLLRVTRNADLTLDEEESDDLLISIQNFLKSRKKGGICRVETDSRLPQEILDHMAAHLHFSHNDVYIIDEIIDMTSLFSVTGERPDLCYPPFKPVLPEHIDGTANIFEQIKKQDIIMYRPFHDFGLVSRMVAAAAADPDVMAIKMTLYRANKNSTILESLIKAVKNGKHVSVVIELKARFDEERNVDWANMLEEAGCIVTYGIAGLKIHAKNLMIVRRESGHVVRYSHMSTGNFNEFTAGIYTDIDYITADDDVGKDSAAMFNFLMGYTDIGTWNRFYLAPKYIKPKVMELIDEEIAFAKAGKEARMIVKVNAIIDRTLMDKLIEASCAGVKIELIVRGICGIMAGIKGVTENIRVRSIVGRFLEHPRIIYFHAGGKKRVFFSTADWMERNMDRRVELFFEVTKKEGRNFLFNILDLNMRDNQKVWMQKGSEYVKVKGTKDKLNYQDYLIENNDKLYSLKAKL